MSPVILLLTLACCYCPLPSSSLRSRGAGLAL